MRLDLGTATIQDMKYTIGERVIVRVFGGYARVRRLWLVEPVGCVVAEDEAFARLLRGDRSGAVALPTEDVYRYDAAAVKELAEDVPFPRWHELTPVASE